MKVTLTKGDCAPDIIGCSEIKPLLFYLKRNLKQQRTKLSYIESSD